MRTPKVNNREPREGRRRGLASTASAWAAAAGPVVSGLVVIGLAGPAHAVPPANDNIEDATRITAVPGTFVGNTTEATARRTDGPCVGGQSVWYRYRPAEDTRVWLTTLGSDYDTLIAVFNGTRTNRGLVACNDDRLGLASAVRPRVTAGTTYWIAVSSCCGPGGELQLNIFPPPPPPSIDVTFTSATTGGVSGRLVLNGTAECGTPSVIYLDVVARQRVGGNVARGSGSIFEVACWPDEPTTLRFRIDSDTGWAFQNDVPALVEGQAFVWDGFTSATSDVEVTVTPTDDALG